MELNTDILYQISLFLSTNDILLFSLVSSYYYNNIMYNIPIMISHVFTLNDNLKDLNFLSHLPYRIYNLDLSENEYIMDKDFIYLKGIHTFNISNCAQNTITDKAFQHLKGIQSMNTFKINKIFIHYIFIFT